MMTVESIEASESWSLYEARTLKDVEVHRSLKHSHTARDPELLKIEQDQEDEYLRHMNKKSEKRRKKAEKQHKKLLREMYASPGIGHTTVHGMMIDAGSTGSRLHIYEWEPRVLHSQREVAEAVSGRKLSYPESTSRWTDRLRPGIATFATLPDEELNVAVAQYLSPLLEFAETVLREKENSFDAFPIFFRATAGMRTLDKKDRSRVLGAVRSLFSNNTYCPFYFEDEFARILSGEEEAIFGWTGINFVMGNLVEESEGAGTVISPKRTYGALDMGGASTQISFYEPEEDIMANLFKLQIGQGKHWNLYAHSFLYFGMNEARNRFQARLLAGTNDTVRLVDGVENPCLPGNSHQTIRLNIHIDDRGIETWDSPNAVSEDGYYQAVLVNRNATGDFEQCMHSVKKLLHLENNEWCNFAHRGECAFNGVAMSGLPRQSEHFGEFLAFSNYFHVWSFLGLPERSSIDELYNATKMVCSMSHEELLEFNERQARVANDEVSDYCFRSAYAYNILAHGYGFKPEEYITATNVLNGQKVGWALGAMLYEINTFAWKYVSQPDVVVDGHLSTDFITTAFVLLSIAGIAFSMIIILRARENRHRRHYKTLKEVEPLMR